MQILQANHPGSAEGHPQTGRLSEGDSNHVPTSGHAPHSACYLVLLGLQLQCQLLHTFLQELFLFLNQHHVMAPVGMETFAFACAGHCSSPLTDHQLLLKALQSFPGLSQFSVPLTKERLHSLQLLLNGA